MGRPAKQILGHVSGVSEVQKHNGQFRVRYYLNGVLSESTRANEEDADALRKSLVVRAETEATGPAQVIQSTWLSTDRIQAAQMAYTALDAHGFPSDGLNAQLIVDAVTFFVEKAKEMQQGIPLGAAYEKFLDSRKGRITARTLKDYGQQVAPFVEKYQDRNVAEINTLECKAWVESFQSLTSQFRCYGYLEAFFSFCAGKHNPHCNGNPWIKLSPVRGFPKPGYSAGHAESYTYKEIVAVLKRAKTKGVLPYFVFRLFSMMRRVEVDRMLAQGDKVQRFDWINTRDAVMQIPADIASQKGKSRNKTRTLKLHETFNAWLRYFSQNRLALAYDHTDEAKVRRSIRKKQGDNILRHTAITMRLKATGDIVTTANEAGNTPSMVTRHYLALNIAKEDAERFYALTPDKARSLGIL